MAKGKEKGFVDTASSSDIPRRTNHLLVIGIDKYQHVGRLSNAARDAKALVKVLMEKYQFDLPNVTEVYDKKATQSRILDVLETFAKRATENDNIIIYFSGHGHYDEFRKRAYWIPCNAKMDRKEDYISYGELCDLLRATQAHHVVIIADSCFSGSDLFRGRKTKTKAFEQHRSRWLVASGRNEVVQDGTPGTHSPFADILFEILQKNPAGKPLRVGSLAEGLIDIVPRNAKQTPIGQALQNAGDKGGQFIFYPRTSPQNTSKQDPFKKAQAANTLEAWQSFIQANPQHPRIKEAFEQIGIFYAEKRALILQSKQKEEKSKDAALDSLEKKQVPKLKPNTTNKVEAKSVTASKRNQSSTKKKTDASANRNYIIFDIVDYLTEKEINFPDEDKPSKWTAGKIEQVLKGDFYKEKEFPMDEDIRRLYTRRYKEINDILDNSTLGYEDKLFS